MDKKNTGLDIHDRRRLAHEARHIQGSLSALLALEKNNLSEEKIRKIVNDLYTKTDKFLELLDLSKKNRKSTKRQKIID
ncbi:MAG: hypothetical protein II563_06240 [Treponema sp.]|nr:hypothetical protein [Acidaminococcaceae bacterium]MBQ2552423.1 hypothetical protein [Treponema sp.]